MLSLVGLLGLLALLILIVIGWGLIADALVQRLVGNSVCARCGVGETGLIGLCALAIVVSAIHWATPINSFATGLLAVVGLAGLIIRSRQLRDTDDLPWRFTVPMLVALTGIALHWLLRAGVFYDAGLYHLPFLTWMQEQPVALGLGNLHGRLGFNSMWLSLSATFALPGTGLRGPFMADAVLFVFYVAILVKHLASQSMRNLPWSTGFAAGLVVSILLAHQIYFASITSTDSSATILTLLAFFLALRLVDQSRRKHDFEAKAWGRDIVLLFAVVGMACTVKLSSIPVALLLFVPLAAQRPTLASPRPLIVGLSILVGLGLLWVVSNVALTGCLAYPVAPTCFDALPWSVGYHQAANEADIVTAWARHRGSTVPAPGWDWVHPWFRDLPRHPNIRRLGWIFVATIPAYAAGFVARLRASRTSASARDWRLTAVPAVIYSAALIGCVFWFLLAPEPRFGMKFLLAMVLVPAAAAAQPLFRMLDYPARRSTKRLEVMAGLVAILSVTILLARPDKLRLVHWDNWPQVEEGQLRQHHTKQGILVWTAEQCWLSPLPCAPYFDPDLRFYRLYHLPLIIRGSHQSKLSCFLSRLPPLFSQSEKTSGENADEKGPCFDP